MAFFYNDNLLNCFVPVLINTKYNSISINIYITVVINNIEIELALSIALNIIPILIINKTMPIMTDINELALCFTTSALFS